MKPPGTDDPLVVVVDHVDEYQMRVFGGIRQVIESQQVPMILHTVDPFAVTAPESLRRLLAPGRVRGVISAHLASREVHEALLALLSPWLGQIPVVMVQTRRDGIVTIGADNQSGMRSLIDHLVTEVGVRRPALLRGILHQPDSLEREAVVRESLAEHGVLLDENLVMNGEFDRDTSYTVVGDLLRRGERMDAVIAFNDISAAGAMEALLEAGLRIPEDVAVTGFDDLELAARLDPPLTSVNQDLDAQGRAAAESVLAMLRGESVPALQIAQSRLVVRGSTALGSPAPVLSPSRYASEVATVDATLTISRLFSTCRSMKEVIAVLAQSFPRLGVTRCFLVLFDAPGAGAHPSGRLALWYCDREARSLGERDLAPFDLVELLPAHLTAELRRGSLVQQPLSVDGEELGYLLFEQDGAFTFSGEVLWLDVNRALESITRTQRLAEYAHGLAEVVAKRTEQLEREVHTRRRAELELQRANTELRRSAFRDGLTGIANRTALDDGLAALWTRHQVAGEELAMALVDVDHFKAYNDRYGHLSGDECLRLIAACLTDAARGEEDLVARYGGEEFALVLPRTSREGARAVGERVRRLVHEAALPHAASPVAPVVTVSVGVAAGYPQRLRRVDILLGRADDALYRAKGDGRDRVTTWTPDMPQPTEEAHGAPRDLAGHRDLPGRALTAARALPKLPRR